MNRQDFKFEICTNNVESCIAAHDGAMPSLNSSDPKVKELAVAYQMIYNLKIRKMKGLEYEPENND